MKSNKKGFTLVELMVVILIIGILIGLSLVASVGVKKSARDGKRKSDLEQIRSALEMYKSDEGEYPDDDDDLVSDYLSELPSDPSGYIYYYYRVSTNTYQLCAHLETGTSDDFCGGGNHCGSLPENCNYETINP